METNLKEKNEFSSVNTASSMCPFCHQPVLTQYYFCPNCGNKLNLAPLSTSTKTQVSIYLFSIILPLLGFIFVKRWPGTKYFKSKDPKTKRIGEIAWVILIFSTIITIWLLIVSTQKTLQSSISSFNADMKVLGY